MLKVGDKVKLRDDLEIGEFYWDIKFISEMKKYEGKEARIVEVSKRDNYRLDIDDGCFWYSAEMLEPIYEFKVGDIVKLRDDFKFVNEIEKYKGKEIEIIEVGKDGYRLDIDGGMFYYSSEMLESIYEFKIGDKVKYKSHTAKIWGVAEKEDCFGGKYAISYINDDGDLINITAKEENLSPVKSKNELEKGDKFSYEYDDAIYTVKCKHQDSGSKLYYFAVDENNKCNLCSADYIEVL